MTQLFRNLFSTMSLERKCLLFFGSALLVLMCIAFLVVEKLGRELVKLYPLNRALDYSTSEVLRRHLESFYSKDLEVATVEEKRGLFDAVRKSILAEDDDNRIYYEIVGFEDDRKYSDLSDPVLPTSEEEERLLLELKEEYRQALALRIARDRPDAARPMDLGQNNPMNQFAPGTPARVHREIGPIEGRGIYYVPIFFTHECMTCHAPETGFSLDPEVDAIAQANQYPFRVGRVNMPYKQTFKATSMIRAIVVALGLLIVAVTLFVLHAIVRHLVLSPMNHLRDVSDRITRGDTDQRAVIETEDEFRELADAFNRMLRHMTETRDQIQDVNNQLDARVDQLAQLNLQLYEANRLKSDFLANMSHELRTPLNSIIGFSEVLQGIDSLTEKQRRYASNIQKSGRLLLEMINDILDLAKVEAGKMEVRATNFDLSRLIRAQCDMMASLVEEKKLELEIRIEQGLAEPYQDANKLGQIVNNLLSNAIKFTPEGGKITVIAEDAGNGRFSVRVTDTGVGIAAEDRDVVFEKFRQSNRVTGPDGLTREYSGTGLGLSIVKELAKLLGGEIDFESKLGHGSSFWVRLPWRFRPLDLSAALPAPRLEAAVMTVNPST